MVMVPWCHSGAIPLVPMRRRQENGTLFERKRLARERSVCGARSHMDLSRAMDLKSCIAECFYSNSNGIRFAPRGKCQASCFGYTLHARKMRRQAD